MRPHLSLLLAIPLALAGTGTAQDLPVYTVLSYGLGGQGPDLDATGTHLDASAAPIWVETNVREGPQREPTCGDSEGGVALGPTSKEREAFFP